MEVIDLLLQYEYHSKQTLFAVSNLRKQKVILRHSWLCKHNLEINWETGEVKMSLCPPCCCTGCWEDAQQEQIAHEAQIHRKDTCSSGPIPELHHDMDDINDSDKETECIDQGNWIFASGLLQSTPSATSRQAPSVTSFRCSLGCHQCGLHIWITGGKWQRLHHGSGPLHYKMISFCWHC